MIEVVSCPKCSGQAAFKIEKCGRSYKVGYYQCETCDLKLAEVMSTKAVPDETLKNIAAAKWDKKAREYKTEESV